MLTIRFRADGGYLTLTMDGHATGSAAACAGASALACTLAGWLDWRGAEVSCTLETGMGRIRCRDTGQTRQAFEVVAVGLAMLAEAHPDKIQLLGKTTGVFPAGLW